MPRVDMARVYLQQTFGLGGELLYRAISRSALNHGVKLGDGQALNKYPESKTRLGTEAPE
jgi:hypothetical protein